MDVENMESCSQKSSTECENYPAMKGKRPYRAGHPE